MKKIISVLLSLALLLGCAAAFAETAEKTELGTVTVNGEFTIQAPIPEGYKMTITDQEGTKLIAEFISEDQTKPFMLMSIGLNDVWEPGVKLNDVSEADLKEIEGSFLEEDPDYQISYGETEHGTKLLIAQLPEKSIVVIYSLYEGYEIEFWLMDLNDNELTQEQIDTCIKLLSDTDFVPVEK